MRITEIKIKLVSRPTDKLLAFASVTFDQSFVVRDIRLIQGNSGLFVAMPSRKMTDRCPGCGFKNHLQAQFCNQCGKRLNPNRSRTDNRGRAKLHADIAHPINSRCRTELQAAILKAYQDEQERARQPGYVAPNFDDYDAGPEGDDEALDELPSGHTPKRLKAAPPPLPAKGAEAPEAPKTRTAEAGADGDGAPPPSEPPRKGDGGGFGIFGE
ncbi:MAG: septation protein SpoVG family protein [Planctomycetota bacterium]|nr:septation protein SpoVG family protein [Planctomycetota bacterium]